MNDNEFVKTVKKEMERIGKGRGISPKREGDLFAIWFATEILMEDEGKVVGQYHIGGKGDEKVDIGISDDDHDVDFVIQCKFSSNPRTTSFNKDLIDEVRCAVERLQDCPEAGNDKRREFASDFSGSGKYTRKIAVGFGSFSESVRRYALDKEVEIYDFDKLKKRYIYSHVAGAIKKPDLAELNISDRKVSTLKGPNFTLYSFEADVNDVNREVKENEDGIFEDNLRFRLVGASKGEIGDKIKTSIKKDPQKFVVLNNGLTITARDVDILEEEDEIRLIEPQIVNGCQTAWALVDGIDELEKAGLKKKVKKARVSVKIIKSTDKELVDEIRLATNKQNPIDARDLKSNDKYQMGLRYEFDNYDPKILYEHKDGLKEELQRKNEYSVYHIGYGRHRQINNERAGQYVLSLLRKPEKAKAEKKKIFEDTSYYKTIFHYDAPKRERFDNGDIGINPDTVKLRTGPKEFVEDILFAHGIYNLSQAYKQLYNEKLQLYDEKDYEDSQICRSLKDKNYFIKRWHFHVISAMNHIVEYLVENNKERKTLRKSLIGDNTDRIWARDLRKSFNLDKDKEKLTILDEENPSSEFRLFGEWMITLKDMMLDIAEKALGDPDWSSWKSFDLSSFTHQQFINRIDEKLGKPNRSRADFFPKPSEL